MRKLQRQKPDHVSFSIGDMHGEVSGKNIKPTLDLLTQKIHEERLKKRNQESEEEQRLSKNYVSNGYIEEFKACFDEYKKSIDNEEFPFTIDAGRILGSSFNPMNIEILSYFNEGFTDKERCFMISSIAVELYEFLLYHTPRDPEEDNTMNTGKNIRESYILYKTSLEYSRTLILIEMGEYIRARFVLNKISLELSDHLAKKQDSFASKMSTAEKEFCRSEEISVEQYFLENDDDAQSVKNILDEIIRPELRNLDYLSEKPPENVEVRNTPYEELKIEFRELLLRQDLAILKQESEQGKNRMIISLERALKEIKSQPNYRPFFFDKCRYD